MPGKKARTLPRRATEKEAAAIAAESAAMEVDSRATATLSSGGEPWEAIYASLPDEERDLLKKVDFSVLQRTLPEPAVLDDESVRMLGKDDLIGYAIGLSSLLMLYVGQYSSVARELGNAMELILNHRAVMFGRSSQRSSSILGNGGKAKTGPNTGTGGAAADGPPATTPPEDVPPTEDTAAGCPSGETAADTPANGTAEEGAADEPPPEAGEGKKKNRPRRSDGCARKVYENAKILNIDSEIPKERLDAVYGEGSWKRLPSADRTVTEYTVIPTTIIVKVYRLYAYSAADCTDPEAPGIMRAENPLSGKRARAKSPISSGMMADILHKRGTLRLPVSRICGSYHSMGLALTPQRVYENISYYSGLFRHLLDRLWAELLQCRYIQADETPVRYYDREKGEMRRGYLWVFTTSEMLIGCRPITLFRYAEGRDAEVLRRCLRDRGFEGVVGSDGLSSYHVFSSAVTYFENQEVYLREFLDDSSIASNNSKSERCFSFFAVLRNQIKMFGSVRGAENAACLESLEQTAREYVENTRSYYQFLIDKYCPFVRAQEDKESISESKEIDDFLPWSERTKDYGKELKEKEKVLTSVAVNF